jgi:hypothetical protein
VDRRIDADCLRYRRLLRERPRQVGDGRQQLPSMSDGGNAEFFQVSARQRWKELTVDLIVTERALVFAEAKASQPVSHVHSHVPDTRDDDRPVWTWCPGGFLPVRNAISAACRVGVERQSGSVHRLGRLHPPATEWGVATGKFLNIVSQSDDMKWSAPV